MHFCISAASCSDICVVAKRTNQCGTPASPTVSLPTNYTMMIDHNDNGEKEVGYNLVMFMTLNLMVTFGVLVLKTIRITLKTTTMMVVVVVMLMSEMVLMVTCHSQLLFYISSHI